MSRDRRGARPSPRLVSHIQELERLEEEKQAAADALRAEFDSAKRAGFDPATLRVVLKLRRMTPEQRRERRALEAIYCAALGMLDGDPLPDEARKRLEDPPEPPPPTKDDEGEQDDDGDTSATTEPAAKPKAPPPPPPQRPLELKPPEEARQEGRDAAAAGKRVYDNPFPAGDPCRAAWDEGWCEKSKSHGMDLPAAYQRKKPPEKPPDEPAAAGDGQGAS